VVVATTQRHQRVRRGARHLLRTPAHPLTARGAHGGGVAFERAGDRGDGVSRQPADRRSHLLHGVSRGCGHCRRARHGIRLQAELGVVATGPGSGLETVPGGLFGVRRGRGPSGTLDAGTDLAEAGSI